ncbi:MAG: LuxR C-terminal-related transcriptional regulator [Acidimicrobiales bacterium]|nr:LuxR C-terminal-related transcriptional regulator [Acidimicrobiales bacterium]
MAWPLIGRESEDRRIREALDDPSRRPVALVGTPGAGTSRLLECVVEHGSRRGWHVCTSVASRALHTVPFGAVAPLAARDGALDTADRLGVIAALEQDLLDAADGMDLLMVVDEAQWLDDASVALLERLRSRRGSRIVIVGRDARAAPAATGWSFATTDTTIIDIGPLGREAHDQLVGTVCDRPVTRESAQRLWDHTGGRPRDLELLLDAIDRAGGVDPDAEVWHWTGEITVSSGLRAVVDQHLAGLGDGARRAYELVAVGAPLPALVADVVLDDDAREELERAELLDSARTGESGAILPARPLVAACVAAGLGPAARRRHLARLAGVHPEPDASWALRHARWAIESAVPLGTADLAGLARLALDESDLDLAEHLADAASTAQPDDVSVRLVLAECLRRGRRADDALAELDVAATHADDDGQRADIAVLRSQIETLLNRAPDAALRHLDAAATTVSDPGATRRLSREQELVRSFVEPVDTVTGSGPVDARVSDARTEELLAVALLRCLHLDLGGLDSVLARLRASVEDHDPEPLIQARIAVCEHLALVGRGGVGEAHAAATTALAAATARGEPLGMWGLCVAFSGPLTGDLDGAAAAAFDADRSFRAMDPFGLRPFSAAVGATAAWQAGRPGMATTLARVAESAVGITDPRIREIAAGRRRAWEAVRRGERTVGAGEAASAARLAMEAGHRLWGVVGLHEAVRLGAAELVIDDLTAAATEIGGALVGAFAAHGESLVAASAAGLDTAAHDLAALGCPLLAAEAAAQASRHGRDETTQARSAARSEIWWRRCSGTMPPALADAPRGLTERQHEIAGLAGRGLSSQEIADRLVVARRTVDNHLRAVYRRLDVASREELAVVLAPALG